MMSIFRLTVLTFSFIFCSGFSNGSILLESEDWLLEKPTLSAHNAHEKFIFSNIEVFVHGLINRKITRTKLEYDGVTYTSELAAFRFHRVSDGVFLFEIRKPNNQITFQKLTFRKQDVFQEDGKYAIAVNSIRPIKQKNLVREKEDFFSNKRYYENPKDIVKLIDELTKKEKETHSDVFIFLVSKPDLALRPIEFSGVSLEFFYKLKKAYDSIF